MNKTENKKNIIPNEDSSKSKRNRNFYIALTLCVAAVSAAGWSTYQSVKNFLSPVGVNSKAKNTDSPKSEKHKQSLAAENKSVLEKNDAPINNSAESRGKANIASIGTEETKAVSAEAGNNLIIYPSTKNVTKEFSGDNPVYSKTFSDWRAHQGTDFRAEEGSMIKAITDGTVKDITNDSVYGTTVIIEHTPGFIAYYCGLGENTVVKPGQELKAGDDIGCIKNVPCEILDEPHLHLMIQKDNKFIDPILILDSTPA